MKNTITILKIGKKFLNKNVVGITFFILAIYLLTFSSKVGDTGVEMVIFDVGQGDSILIQQDNFQILVDGGPNSGIVQKVAERMPLFDKTIEVVVLTHPHEDHVRGLMNILREYDVEKILINRVESGNKAYRYLLEQYSDILTDVVEGDTVEYGDILLKVLYPFEEERGQDKNLNNESVVLLGEINSYRILLMGDAEKEVERRLIEHWDLESIDFLKVGHHCSRTSSSEMFLSTINPKVAICSLGEGNKFGHPHYETIEKFQKLDVQYLITSKEGDIVINFSNL